MTSVKPHIRWMIRRDLDEIVKIENDIYVSPNDADSLLTFLSRNDITGLVIEEGGYIVGYAIYQMKKHSFFIWNLTIARHHQGRGYGKMLLKKLMCKMSVYLHHTIKIEVLETNLASQLFLRSCGFMWVETISNGEDNPASYIFKYTIRG